MRAPPSGKDKLPEGRAWLPSAYMVRVYSSSTGRWEERPFVREEGATRTIANNVLSAGFEPWVATYHGAYWHGALYVYWRGVYNAVATCSFNSLSLSLLFEFIL